MLSKLLHWLLFPSTASGLHSFFNSVITSLDNVVGKHSAAIDKHEETVEDLLSEIMQLHETIADHEAEVELASKMMVELNRVFSVYS